MKKYSFFFLFLTVTMFSVNIYARHHKNEDAKTVLTHLIDGNKRFTESKANHPNQSSDRIKETSKGQNPVAVILTCSDSRVPPEILFDQGIGDLFVIRTAGNLVDDIGLGSIEYAGEHLGVNLVVVLGHERCGAVDAAVKGGDAHGHIVSLIKEINPAVELAKKERGDLLENSVQANIKAVVQKLKSSQPLLKKFVSEKKLEIIGARYDLDDGNVSLIK